MATVMLALSVTISKIFAVEIVHDHDLDLWNGSNSNTTCYAPLEGLPMMMKHINQKPIPSFPFDWNCNVCYIGHISKLVCSQNVHDLDHDF